MNSVKEVVAHVYSGNGEGPARKNPVQKTLPMASNEQLACLEGGKKKAC